MRNAEWSFTSALRPTLNSQLAVHVRPILNWFLVVATFTFSGCHNNPQLLNQPEPATAVAAIADMQEILGFYAYNGVKDVKITEDKLTWTEQTHTPKLGWKNGELLFADVKSVVYAGEGPSGWLVRLECSGESVRFELEKPEYAGKLIAALKKLTRK